MESRAKGKDVSHENILIVDDEENLLLLLERILTRQGYQVVTAQNSHDACNLLKTRTFQLAILDIKMFPLDGVFLLGEIKGHSPSTKVIMVTAYPTVNTRAECMKKGASTYLTKPLDIQELKTTVDGLLSH
ncbi:MAG TPA: response regulator [Candidatus Binatia bacterium]|nr:response regulator [Candidatus Binatia bacterium]